MAAPLFFELFFAHQGLVASISVPATPFAHRAVPQKLRNQLMFISFYIQSKWSLGYLPVHSGRMPGKLSEPSGLNLVHGSFFQSCASTIDHPQAADFT
ncbi:MULTISPECIES: hypothetical protein [Pseudomonas]|uniref:hypothetical protein n=1 Tax=Pseudomonas TaxID=286 RepID=UPI00113FDB42|nr:MULTISPECIES: hypothetical protein [Pseudomonas]